MSRRVLITGVSGFIGSNLLDLLLETTDWQITGIDNLSTGNISNIETHLINNRFRFLDQDLSELNSLKEYQTVFHLAALPRIQPSFIKITEHIQANLLLAMHLIEIMIAEEYFPKLIYSGSSAIYGTPVNYPTTESERIDCLSPYAFQKYEVEKYLELIGTRYPLDFVTLRYFNPYGPRSFNPSNRFNAYSSVVGIFLNQKKNGEPLTITGDGSQKRDFIHVKDVALANYKASMAPDFTNKAYNVGFGKTISILDLAKMISSDYKFIDKREGESMITWADISKINAELVWVPTIDISDYLKYNSN